MSKTSLSKTSPLSTLMMDCIDGLQETLDLLQCQSDSLQGLAEHHPDRFYHITFSQLIFRKLSSVSESLESINKDLRMGVRL